MINKVVTRQSAFANHDEYLAAADPKVRPALAKIRRMVKKRLPDALETISYSLPAFKRRRVFFYFAAFKRHIGVYPPVTEDADLINALTKYRNEKGNLAFPLDEPIPYELIEQVAVALAKQYG